MKYRIYKTVSGDVVVDTPSSRYQGDNFDLCPHPWRFRDSNPIKEPFEMEVITGEQLHEVTDGKNEAGSAQFYYDGSTLKHDHDWSELLMRKGMIQNKHRARLLKKLDDELDKPNPDPVKVIKLQRDREKVKDWTDKGAYQQALRNLDEDGLDKPKIRAKLAQKIAAME